MIKSSFKYMHCTLSVHSFIHSVQFQFQFQFSFIYFTLGYRIYIVYVTNRIKKKKEKKKEVNGFGRSVRWSEELSFRADHRYMEILILLGVMATMDDQFYIKIYIVIFILES